MSPHLRAEEVALSSSNTQMAQVRLRPSETEDELVSLKSKGLAQIILSPKCQGWRQGKKAGHTKVELAKQTLGLNLLVLWHPCASESQWLGRKWELPLIPNSKESCTMKWREGDYFVLQMTSGFIFCLRLQKIINTYLGIFSLRSRFSNCRKPLICSVLLQRHTHISWWEGSWIVGILDYLKCHRIQCVLLYLRRRKFLNLHCSICHPETTVPLKTGSN